MPTNSKVYLIHPDGCLHWKDYAPPTTNEEAFGLCAVRSVSELLVNEECCVYNWRLEAFITEICDIDELPDSHTIESWIQQMTADAQSRLLKDIQEWLAAPPNFTEYSEYMMMSDDTRGEVWLEMEPIEDAILDALSLTLVEGDRPGSSLSFVEIGISCDDANRIAGELGVAWRFEDFS
jgi:hypothetical protein